jgi:hypothetical protein
MTDTQFTSTPETRESANQSRLGRWIEDPFASVIGGIVIPAFAVVLLLSSMAGLSGLVAV